VVDWAAVSTPTVLAEAVKAYFAQHRFMPHNLAIALIRAASTHKALVDAGGVQVR
jgi:hypothetical protein